MFVCTVGCIMFVGYFVDANMLSDASYVLCLDGLGKSDEIYLHVSKPPKEDSPGSHFLQVQQTCLSKMSPQASEIQLCHYSHIYAQKLC